jgi:polar amino acid transport system substrate-binding protein
LKNLNNSTSLLALIVAIVLIGIILKSCSNDEEGAGKLYYIARDPTWNLSTLMGKDKNMTAFSDDLLLNVAKTSNIRVHITNSSPESLFSGLYSGEYNAILAQTLPTPITQQTLLFSNPYFLLGPVLVTEANTNITSIEEMGGKTIGIEQGMSTLFDIKKYPAFVFTSYDNVFKALGALDNDKIDGVLMNAFPAQIYIKTFYPNRLKIATAPLTKEGLRLVALKNSSNQQLIEAFNQSLNKFIADGTYDEMIKKWGLVNTMAPIKSP